MQTRAIKLARERARPVIVATQMLESMISSPRPTRAEVSDVAGAVTAGADAVMLSAETSVGAYPIETVATMSRIVAAAEESSLRAEHHLSRMPTTTGGAIARAAAEVGAIVGAKALVAFTMTGETARRLARYRSPIPLMAFTTDPAIRSQLALTWGVETFIVPERAPHRRHGPRGRLGPGQHEPLRHRRQDRHRGGQPARQPGQDQRAARSPHRRRHQPALSVMAALAGPRRRAGRGPGRAAREKTVRLAKKAR